jgi:hypothetical protein
MKILTALAILATGLWVLGTNYARARDREGWAQSQSTYSEEGSVAFDATGWNGSTFQVFILGGNAECDSTVDAIVRDSGAATELRQRGFQAVACETRRDSL